MSSVKRYILLTWCVLTAALGIVRADDGFNPVDPPEPMQQTLVSISATPADATSSITLGGLFSIGKHITVSVTPKSDYVFRYWTLNGVQHTTERTFDYEVGMQQAGLVAVLEHKPLLSVSVTPSDAGSAYGAGRYEAGSSVLIKTYANTGYTFQYWTLNNEQYTTESSFYYTMGSEDASFVAVYKEDEVEPEPPFDPEDPLEPLVYYRVKVTTNLPDGVKPSDITPGGSYAPGRNITLRTNTPDGYVFLYWTLNEVLYSEQLSCPYVVGDSDVVFTACFARKHSITLSVTPEGAGTVSGAGTYAPNSKVLVSTTPRDGYVFRYWMRGDEVYTEALAFYYLVNTVDAEFVAVYEQITNPSDDPDDPDDPDEPFSPSNPPEPETDKVPLNITVGVDNPELGYVTGLPLNPLFTGDVITLTAVPNNADKYAFQHWADGSTANPREITLSVDARFVAVFAKLGAANLSVNGVVSAEDLDLGTNSTVKITPDGHLVVPSPVYVHKLSLNYKNGHHAQVTGITNVHAEAVELVLNLPTPKGVLSKHWFAIAVPFEVSVATGIRLSGSDTPARSGYDFVIDEFDGAKRAAQQKGWKRVAADAVLHPGRMYMFATPKGTSWVLTAADSSELTEETEAAISAYPSTIRANHAGWNGIANTMYANATAARNGIMWATTYNNTLGVYETQMTEDYVFNAAMPFFVQVAKNLSFAFDDIPLSAPVRAQDDELSPVSLLTLTDAEATYSDKAYLNLVAAKDDDAYRIGHDLQKIDATSQTVHQLWWDAYDMQLSAYEAPIGDEPRLLPIGLYAPEDGDYTLSLTGVPAGISAYLTKDGQPVWDIVASDYTLQLSAGNNDGYVLYVRRVKDVTTDCRTTETETKVQKVVMDGKVFILRDGKTYTVLGAEVK